MDGQLRCLNLQIISEPGTPMATKCKVYHNRSYGMPIVLVNPNGVIEAIASCTFGDGRIEMKEIIEKGIGKGCSMEVVENG